MTFDEHFLHWHGPENPPPKPIKLDWDTFRRAVERGFNAGLVEGQANVGRIIEDTIERVIERMRIQPELVVSMT